MTTNEFKDDLFKEKDRLLALFKGFILKNDKKTGGNLRKSNLLKSIRIKKVSNKIIISANDYIVNVDKGRKKNSKKVPINEILKFIKKNKISGGNKNINSLAFAIQNSIYKEGIKPRNFLEPSLRDLKKEIDKIGGLILDKQLNNI